MSDLFGGLVLISAGTLYPAYSSYKAVKTKNTREYVKWMMYWIVFAFFNAITLFTDVFVSWFPGYYLFKTLFILWLVSPATRGSTYLYKRVLHPALRQNEEKIDRTISNIKNRGYDYTSQYARLAMQNFSRSLMEAVFKGQVLIADQMQRQYLQTNAGPTVETDGREHDRPVRSAAALPPPEDPYGRLYRVDSQMFEMDDEFVELSAEMDADPPEPSSARLRRRGKQVRGTRPVSMPPATIQEHHPLLDEDAPHSDPDYYPPEHQHRRSLPNPDDVSQRRVTRSTARREASQLSPEEEEEEEDENFE